ncbi:MAG TPA: DUF502 domain-containing protein [Pseudomonadales bacterium]|nr:DUF502 domain-containing protein [Pseudomonadales bacterium]
MKQILSWMAKGLLAVLPIIVTLYLLWWLVTTAEGVLAPVIKALFGAEAYVPGSGLVLVAAALVGTGILIDAYVGRWVLTLMEAIVDRVPLVKTIYGAVQDLLRFVIPSQSEQQARRVVAWQASKDAWLVGFVTGEPIARFDALGDSEDWVAVYFPMSYQVGGYTLTLRERDLEALDMKVEDAMRSVLTAGVARRVTGSPDRPTPG